ERPIAACLRQQIFRIPVLDIDRDPAPGAGQIERDRQGRLQMSDIQIATAAPGRAAQRRVDIAELPEAFAAAISARERSRLCGSPEELHPDARLGYVDDRPKAKRTALEQRLFVPYQLRIVPCPQYDHFVVSRCQLRRFFEDPGVVTQMQVAEDDDVKCRV